MALPISKEYLLTQLRNFKSIVLDPAYIIQKETLPLATAQNLGAIFQYTGNDAVNYTIGGFYQVQVVPETDPAEYAWVEVSTKTLIDGETIQRNADKELYVPAATDAALGVVQAGDGIDVDANGVISVVARLEEIAELPTATAALEGKIYLLTATQTGYDRGGIYMCEESTETAGTYEWKLISMSPLEAGKGITIEDDVISADTNVFNGTLDEWEALTAEEQAQYSHIATPEEDGVDTQTVVELLKTVEYTTTDVTYSLDSGKKFSDYSMIIATMSASGSANRNSIVLPLSEFVSKGFSMMVIHGSDTDVITDYSVCSNTCRYVSDTSFVGRTIGSGMVNQLTLYGMK